MKYNNEINKKSTSEKNYSLAENKNAQAMARCEHVTVIVMNYSRGQDARTPHSANFRIKDLNDRPM